MIDYDWINQRIALGGNILTQEDMDSLLFCGITDIINVQLENDEEKFLEGKNVNYLHIGVEDDNLPKEDSWYMQALQFSFKALIRPESKIYIHCMKGRSRSAAIVYTLLRALGFSATQTTEMMVIKRPSVELYKYQQSAEDSLGRLGY